MRGHSYRDYRAWPGRRRRGSDSLVAMAELVIRPVRTRRDLKRFVKVPFGLHRDNSLWVPPLIYDRMQFLNRAKNPYFEHAEAEYFIAERGGEPVGRITAQIDRLAAALGDEVLGLGVLE